MKTIIALWGSGSQGKTTAVVRALSKLLDKYNPTYENLQPNWKVDIKYILHIKGKKVGLNSQGDFELAVTLGLESFEEAGCEIMVVAVKGVSDRAGGIRAIQRRENDYSVQWVKQEDISQTEENAEKIMSMVDEALEGR